LYTNFYFPDTTVYSFAHLSAKLPRPGGSEVTFSVSIQTASIINSVLFCSVLPLTSREPITFMYPAEGNLSYTIFHALDRW